MYVFNYSALVVLNYLIFNCSTIFLGIVDDHGRGFPASHSLIVTDKQVLLTSRQLQT